MNNISAIIVAKDNPPHFFETLESVAFAQEIIVIDIGLSHHCKEKISKYQNVKIVPIHEDVSYVEQIREKSKSYASHEWILILDPDEIVPKKLANALMKAMDESDYVSMPRKNIIFGKWIQHSRWWPDYQIRFFKKDAVSWPVQIHAQPKATGCELKLEPTEETAITHYNYENITEYLMKMIRYAQAEAKEKIDSKHNYSITAVVAESLQEFISRFFAEKGFKDGTHGLVLAFLQMVYKWLVYFYVWEGKNYPEESLETITKIPHDFFAQGLYETNHWLRKENLISKTQEFKNKIINKLL